MRKKIFLSTLLVLFTLIITSCNSSKNTALDNLNINKSINDKSLAVIINYPDKDELEKVENLKTYESDNSGESLLLVPTNNMSKIKIIRLKWEDDNLKEDEVLYMEEKTPDNFALHIKAVRPEGIPMLKIKIYNNNSIGEYIISYNGKTGTPDIEYINKNE